MKKKINPKLYKEINTMKEYYNDNIDNMIKSKANNSSPMMYSEIDKLTTSEFAELLINGYELVEEYNIVNLPNVFRFSIPKGSFGTNYICMVVKDRAVISCYNKYTETVNSYEYDIQEVLHYLNCKVWKMEGTV